MTTKISDLLDVIHLTVIKNSPAKENDIMLDELKSIDEKIKNGLLANYTVDVPFFRTIILTEIKNI